MDHLHSFSYKNKPLMQSPIFIFSLPRAGSTLLQRVLMTNKDIASVAEPWLLLPQIYVLKKQGTLSEFSSLTSNKGITDFINNLPQKEQDYLTSLRRFILELYEKQCKNNERYFLDKTPRYYLIINEINALFPDAKFIFLFRNPIHVYASILNTWGNNRLSKFHGNYNDLSEGFKMLSDGFVKFKNKSIAVNYENFILKPESELKKISQYLDLNIEVSALENFHKEETNGKLGDPTGTKLYTKISEEGLDKWKLSFNSLFRKKIAIRVIKKIDDQSFKLQGYDKNSIINDIKGLNNKKNNLFIIDLFDYYSSSFIRVFNLNLLKNKEFLWVRKKFLS